MARERERVLGSAALALALAGFTAIAVVLGVPEMTAERIGYSLAAMVVVVGSGVVVTRALADPAVDPEARSETVPSEAPTPAPPMDRRLVGRVTAMGGCLAGAGILAVLRGQTASPDEDLTAVFFGLFLGGGIVSGILALRRVRPPRRTVPLHDLVGAHYGDLLEPAHIRVLHELIESGEVDESQVLSAPYEEVAGWLEAKGHEMPHEQNDWEKKVESQRRRRERERPSQVLKRSGGQQPPLSRQPGRQQRGTR